MKKRMLAIAIALIIMSMAPGSALHAVNRSARHITVTYVSPAGGPGPSVSYVAGEWDVDCDGNWSGWGSRPGDPDTRTTSTILYYCQQWPPLP